MIATDLSHAESQLVTTPCLQKAISFLRHTDLQALPEGKVVIDGDQVFALFQLYDSVVADAPKFEAHRKYIDVQYVASGEEIIGWAPTESMNITMPYNEDKDICLGTLPAGQMTPVYLRAGQLAVLYPEDGHAPRLAAGKSSPVRKVVIKVAV